MTDDAREEAKRRRYAEVVGGLGVIVPVHLAGGPCADTAPAWEKFLSLDDYGAFALDKTTCEACRIHYELVTEGGGTNAFRKTLRQPSEFSKQYRKTFLKPKRVDGFPTPPGGWANDEDLNG